MYHERHLGRADRATRVKVAEDPRRSVPATFCSRESSHEPPDDYVTRGVALGGNSSAIATALLLGSDPRAAALSSLSMGLFGTAMVALTSVPPVVRIVSGLVGLERP